MRDDTPGINVLELELACEMLTALLHEQQDVVTAVLGEDDRQRRYELAFEGLQNLWIELTNQYGDRLPATLAQMTMAREDALRQQVVRRERLEHGRS